MPNISPPLAKGAVVGPQIRVVDVDGWHAQHLSALGKRCRHEARHVNLAVLPNQRAEVVRVFELHLMPIETSLAHERPELADPELAFFPVGRLASVALESWPVGLGPE